MRQFEKTTQTIDSVSGELLESKTENVFIKKTTADHYYMTFIETMGPILGIKSLVDRNVLDAMCRLCEYNTCKVFLTPGLRKKLCDEIGVTSQQFSNSISKLKKLSLVKGEAGDYELNPKILWKGDLKERRKVLSSKGISVTIEFRSEE